MPTGNFMPHADPNGSQWPQSPHYADHTTAHPQDMHLAPGSMAYTYPPHMHASEYDTGMRHLLSFMLRGLTNKRYLQDPMLADSSNSGTLLHQSTLAMCTRRGIQIFTTLRLW